MADIPTPEQVEAIRERLTHAVAQAEWLRAEASLADRPGQYARLLAGAQRWEDDLSLLRLLLGAYDALTARAEAAERKVAAVREVCATPRLIGIGGVGDNAVYVRDVLGALDGEEA